MKWEELQAKYLAPVENAARRIFSSPDGAKILHALEAVYGGDPTAKDAQGRVDADATLINVGSARVVNYLRKLAEPKKDREP
jgi:hypothetical protein